MNDGFFQDKDTIVLKPGEILILRPRRTISIEELQRFQETLKLARINAVFVSHDFDMFVGVNMTTPDPPQESQCEAAKQAYEAGRVIMFRAIADRDQRWYEAHKHASPHMFDDGVYEYKVK